MSRCNSYACDGVDVIATIAKNNQNHLIAIANYRVPVNRYVLELPSGLTDQTDPNPSATAIRELKEETGYTATLDDIIHISPITHCDP